eukprot:3191320-Amphidinium_carterae.1
MVISMEVEEVEGLLSSSQQGVSTCSWHKSPQEVHLSTTVRLVAPSWTEAFSRRCHTSGKHCRTRGPPARDTSARDSRPWAHCQ